MQHEIAHRFRIVEQVDPPARHPFQIVETFQTKDGPRSRLCSGMFTTLEEAQHEVASVLAGPGGIK